jgi:hypothetical protein
MVTKILQMLFMAATLMGMASAAALAGTTVLTVGPSQQYPTIAAAVAAANGDTNPANEYVISVAPGTYTNDTAQINRPMTIQAAVAGSAVILNQTVQLPNEKGILLTFATLTVDGLTLQNAAIDASLGANGAGIRAEAGGQTYTLTVRNTTFINNQMGILTDTNFPLDTVLVGNTFINNGNGDVNSLGHSVYISTNNSLTAIGNEICGTILGHDIKSRAAINVIENNTLYDGAADPNQPSCTAGSTSFALDLPNGGVALVMGNTMIQGSSTQNEIMFAYGEEGLIYQTNSLTFMDNTMENTLGGAIGIYENSNPPIPVIGSGNTFAASIATQVDPTSADELAGSGSSGSLSPDGTVSVAAGGASLTSSAGSWTWGPGTNNAAQCGPCYELYLNGVYANGDGLQMEVAHGGQLYVFNNTGWYRWNGSWVWTGTGAP